MIRKALLSTALATLIGVSTGSFALAQTTGPGAGKSQGGGGPGGPKTAMFDKCDTNGDGRLSKEEFKSCHSARAEKKFSRIDTNHDGSISREEAQQWAQRKGSRGGAGGAAGPGAGQRGGPSGGSSQ